MLDQQINVGFFLLNVYQIYLFILKKQQMSSSNTRNASRSPISKYNSLKNQLDNETSVLISERDELSRSGFRGQAKKLSRTTTGLTASKVKETKGKINNTIGLVENDRQNNGSEFNKIISAEKQILDLLKQTSNFSKGNTGRKVKGWTLEEITEEDIDFLRSLDKEQLIRMLLEALRLYREEKSRRVWIENQLKKILGLDPEENPENNFGISSRTNIKPLSTIPFRPSKESVNLEINLNDQIYELKTKLAESEKQSRQYKKENERLKNRSGLIIGKDGYTGYLDLFKQGQKIRDQTACLIQTKQGEQSCYPYEKIQELERQLKDQEQAKVNFLMDLKKFKQKFKDLEEENQKLKQKLKVVNSEQNYNSRLNKQNVNRTSYN